MPTFLPVLAMLGATLLWASSPTSNKLAFAFAGVPDVIAFRICGAALVLWLAGLLIFRRNYSLSRVGWRPMAMGVLEPGLVTVFIALGVANTSAVNAAVVWSILPVTQPLLARLVLGEPIQKPVIFGAVLAVSGSALLFALKQQEGSGTLFGDAMLLCGVMCAACNQLIARTVATSVRDPLVTTCYQLFTASLLSLALLAWFGGPSIGPADLRREDLGVLLALIVTTAGPFFLYNTALQHLPVGRVSLFAPLSGPVGATIASLVFDEALSAGVLGAIALVLAGAMAPPLSGWLATRRR